MDYELLLFGKAIEPFQLLWSNHINMIYTWQSLLKMTEPPDSAAPLRFIVSLSGYFWFSCPLFRPSVTFLVDAVLWHSEQLLANKPPQTHSTQVCRLSVELENTAEHLSAQEPDTLPRREWRQNQG